MAASARLRKLLKLERAATHDQIKAAYNQQIKRLHPDSVAHLPNHLKPPTARFIQLQQAWETFAKTKSCTRSEGDFTQFGVGCSFADTNEEKNARIRFMDQAALGQAPTPELPTMDRAPKGDGATIRFMDHASDPKLSYASDYPQASDSQ